MSGLLGIAVGSPGSGRTRYAVAMALYQAGQISAAQLEAYRAAAGNDRESPAALFVERNLTMPDSDTVTAEAAILSLVEAADTYLSTLTGPGIAEIRAGIARWRNGTLRKGAGSNLPLISQHLPAALDQLRATHPDLAHAIAQASPHLNWVHYDLYGPEIGEVFPGSNAYVSLIGADAAIAAGDFDLGLFLMAPHVLYRDHHHGAQELYAPLTGPHGWRFGANRPLVVHPAHHPVWNWPHRPHLTKVGPTPFLALFGWTGDLVTPSVVIPAEDWPTLEAMRLDP